MKHIQIVLAFVIGSLVCQSAHAVLFRVSQIANYATGNLGASGVGDIPDGWNNPTSQVTVTNGSGSLIGTNLGLVASAGDRVNISATASLSARINWAPNGAFPQSIETNLYYSFLYQFNNAEDVSIDGEKIIMVNRANSGNTTGIHWELYAKNIAGQIQIGLFKALGNTTNYATTNISAGTTIFVVVRQHIITGAQNDLYDLWINPATNTFGVDETSVPPSSASTGALASDGTEDASGTGPERLWVASGANAYFDEFRVASTWAEVTPPVGQCLDAGIALDPTNQTVTAGITATHRVAANGTNPSLQWQVSTDNGTNWISINSANLAAYRTPRLTLADSGNRYRVIVTVPCNGSSATSAVATVTVTSPAITPPGLVVHDLFEDLLRDNTPVGISNSVWRTAVSANLDAFTTPGVMVGTPVAGGSSLWLGYFTDDSVTNLPVHLDIWRTLKATLPFTPNSFNSFTNNASLRIGLFDYADGGARLTGDGSAAGGSSGNGVGVRGYMLALNWGTNFTDNTPLQILARNNLDSINLMGTTGDYVPLGSGPAGLTLSNTPAFQAGTEYTLEFSVTRLSANSVDVTTTITGGGDNWSFSVVDTNFVYHRFDAFGLRPNSLETSADSFTFAEFKVAVIPLAVPQFNITEILRLSASSVKLTWNSLNGVNYQIQSRDSLSSGNWTTNAIVPGAGASTSYTNSGIAGSVTNRYYRVAATPQ